MKLCLVILLAVLISSCTTSPRISDEGIQQVRASLPAGEDEVKLSRVGIWLPNSKEFRFTAVEPSIKGVVVLTGKSLVFQRWGGPTGLVTLHYIPYKEMRSAHMETIGRSGRLVIESVSGRFDSFAVSDGLGELSLGRDTEEMHRVLKTLGSL